ncbi:TonB-dependent receptor [Chitinophagaceae bacterium 26-R-25]|nr:TonB-dependent receptor [Chitinophagaceae bacterium 26-R-25]
MKLIAKKCLCALTLTLFLGATALAQTRTITGTVKDQSGQPLKGVNVMVKGTKTGSTTDETGRYSLSVDKNAVLILSFTGYTSKEIPVSGSQSSLITQLTVADKSLEDVVVVGYGKQKKINMTGAVETISAKQLENRPVTSATAMLQGTAPSLVFSAPSGGNTPGSRPTVQIRGSAAIANSGVVGTTEPLVVIDGIPGTMTDFDALNPNDIESVSVLKDAAASAVYGARAPYGVLVISTKMAKRNESPQFTYDGNFAKVTPVRVPHTVDAYTYALAIDQGQMNVAGGNANAVSYTKGILDTIQDNILHPGKYTYAQLNPFIYTNGTPSGYGTAMNNNDMVDVWLRSSFRQQHNFSVRGGSDKTTYFLSGGYVNQPGVLNYVQDIDNFKRYNINGSLMSQVNDWLKLSYHTRYSLGQSTAPIGGLGLGRSGLYTWIFGSAPTTPVMTGVGELNPTMLTASNGGSIVSKSHRLDNILGADINILKGLTAHIDGTWRLSVSDYQSLTIPVITKQPNGSYMAGTGANVSSLTKQSALETYWTVQGYMAYEYALKKHTFRIQAGASAEEDNYKNMTGTNINLYTPDLPAFAVASGASPSLSDAVNTWATAGFFGRFNYNYDSRYLLEVNGRYDGSGRYSADKRWGVFPSASAGWNMSNEKFWKGIASIVNRAKIRASYGTVGNQGNAAGYLHIPTMTTGNKSSWLFNGATLPYVNMPGILNMDRTWEKLTTADVGLELGFLNNRLTSEFDYFNRRAWDVIGPATPVPTVLGTTAPDVNNAEFVTKGWEAQVKWADNINQRWNYSVGLGLSDAQSKVTKYNNPAPALTDWYVGKKFGEIWGYVSDRLLTQSDFPNTSTVGQQPIINQSKISNGAKWYAGDVKYEDLNGDKVISPGASSLADHGDLKIIGNSTPRYRFNFTLASGYSFPKAGRVDVSIFLEGVGKRDLFMGSTYSWWGGPISSQTSIAQGIYQGDKSLDFYRDANSDARVLSVLGQNVNSYFPRPYTGAEGAKNFATSSRYLVSGAYMRLKNVMLTYSLPNQWLNVAKIKTCRFYFSAENIAVLSAKNMPNYIDPENGVGLSYPQQATYSFGVNLGF